MGILRILLVLGLIAGAAYLVIRAPWRARLHPTATSIEMGTAPLWAPPEKPPLRSFPGFTKSPEIPRDEGVKITVDTGVEIIVELDRRNYFGKTCAVVVGLFFLFGVAGTIVQRRPKTPDVAFSLWLSLGLLGGIITSATMGNMGASTSLPYFSQCLLVGFIIGLLVALRSQTGTPFLKSRGKQKGSANNAT